MATVNAVFDRLVSVGSGPRLRGAWFASEPAPHLMRGRAAESRAVDAVSQEFRP